MTREVSWGGIHNTRDLGGLPGPFGSTKFGRIFRMPRPDALTVDGWSALESAGVRTLIDLRNSDEIAELPLLPAVVSFVHRAIEDQGDDEFMELMAPFLGSPSYYAENLRRWPDKIAAVIRSVANSPKGGVVIHCSAGRDRTGLITALILSLCDVELGAILDDYELGVRRTNDYLATHDNSHERHRSDNDLDAAIDESRQTLAALFLDLDVDRYLRDAGCSEHELTAVRVRLLED
ncbi:MAG: tyrosine-protein phosphatase [Salinibacterium sp.]|nr:tyrosine-protein phosphatase [Salinibacterium sp.]